MPQHSFSIIVLSSLIVFLLAALIGCLIHMNLSIEENDVKITQSEALADEEFRVKSLRYWGVVLKKKREIAGKKFNKKIHFYSSATV